MTFLEKATKESLFLDKELEPSAVMNLSIEGSRSEGLSAPPAKKKSDPMAIWGSDPSAPPSGW